MTERSLVRRGKDAPRRGALLEVHHGVAVVITTIMPARPNARVTKICGMARVMNLKYAVRMLVKDPWFTLVAALALGLGIGVNSTVFTFVNAVLLRGLPFKNPDQIVHFNAP